MSAGLAPETLQGAQRWGRKLRQGKQTRPGPKSQSQEPRAAGRDAELHAQLLPASPPPDGGERRKGAPGALSEGFGHPEGSGLATGGLSPPRPHPFAGSLFLSAMAYLGPPNCISGHSHSFLWGLRGEKKLKFHQAADKELPLKRGIWFRFAPKTVGTPPKQGRVLLTNHLHRALGS